MKARGFAPLIPTLVFAALAACSPQQASKSGAEESPAPVAIAQTSPAPASEVVSEADARTHDELGAGHEVAPAEPAPEPSPSVDLKAADLEAKERELARRERDLRAREARVARTAIPKPARDVAPKPAPEPAPAEPEAIAPEDSENPEIAEGTEPGDDADRGYDSEPADQPEPERAPPVTVPAGAHLTVELLGGLSSATAKTGDTFRVRVARDVGVDGETVIPEGAEVQGVVGEASGARRGSPARLELRFTDLVLPDGETLPIHAVLQQIGEQASPGRKAAAVGGGAAAGAVLGRALSGSGSRGAGTVIGALVGALAGAAIASHSTPEQIEIPAGTLMVLKLDRDAEIGGGAR
ncbi:MAG: glycine zipper 2TM domain-containing protein [Acidobacteriota bacterium]